MGCRAYLIIAEGARQRDRGGDSVCPIAILSIALDLRAAGKRGQVQSGVNALQETESLLRGEGWTGCPFCGYYFRTKVTHLGGWDSHMRTGGNDGKLLHEVRSCG